MLFFAGAVIFFMADLKARLTMIDEISDKFDNMSRTGVAVIERVEKLGQTAEKSFSSTTDAVNQAARKTDEYAQAVTKAASGTAQNTKNTAEAASASRDLAAALNSEAERSERAAREVRIKADTTERMAAAMREYYDSLKATTDAEGKYTEELDKTMRAALFQAERLERSAAALRDKADQAEYAARATRDGADELNKSARAADAFGSEMTTAAAELNNFGAEAVDAGNKSEEFGDKAADAIKSLQGMLVAAGIVKSVKAIGTAFWSTIESAVEFESAITGVYKTVDGTDAQLAAISSDIKEMARVMPASTIEIAGVAEAAGQLGIATDDITAFTKVMINLGESTNLTADAAASALAKFVNITGMSSTQYENLGSSIVALGNNFATTEADIVAMSTRMASAGTLAGLTEPDILALAAAVSSVGIEADAGGSAMSKLLTDMQVAVETGSDRLEEFAAVAGMTGSQFADAFGDNAANALYAFISGLNDVERNGASATVVLEDMGFTEVRLSNAIKALAGNSGNLAAALNLSNSAWDKNNALANEANMRYATLESKMAMAKNAMAEFSTAVGAVLAPSAEKATTAWTGFVNRTTNFVESNPNVVRAVAAVAAVIGVLVGAVTAYNVVIKIAPMLTKLFTAALSANPYFLIATAIAAVVAGLVVWMSSMQDVESEYDKLTVASRENYDAMNEANAQYEESMRLYGEEDERTLRLRNNVDELTEAYENNKQTYAEYRASVEETLEQHDRMVERHRNTTKGIEDERIGIAALIEKLEELAGASDLAAGGQAGLISVVDELNERLHVNITIDDIKGNASGVVAYLKILNNEKARLEHGAADVEEYKEWVEARARYQTEYADASREYEAAQKTHELYSSRGYGKGKEYNVLGLPVVVTEWNDYRKNMKPARDKADKTRGDVESLAAIIAASDKEIAALETRLHDMGLMVDGMPTRHYTYEEAVNSSVASVREEMGTLAEEYDAAYASARESLDGACGLFDKLEVKSGLSINAVIANLESQSKAFGEYSEGLDWLSGSGLDADVLRKLGDGSIESMGQVKAFADELKKLSPEEQTKKINELNNALGDVAKSKDEAANSMAEVVVDFGTRLDEIKQRLADGIDDMNMSDKARVAAKSTMNAYIDEIRNGVGSATSAARAVSAATINVLSTENLKAGASMFNFSSIAGTPAGARVRAALNGYAEGTLSAAPGYALVGEYGPELVKFGGGEVVYPADKTSQMLNRDSFFVPFDMPERSGANEAVATESTKRFIIELDGKGELIVKGNADKSAILDVLQDELRPVLMSILDDEMHEEGDGTYDY